MITLEDLDKRLLALEGARPADLRKAVERLGEILEETRLRMSAVERQLEDIRRAMFEATAEAARRHGQLDAKIDAVRAELKADIAGLRRDMPSIVAEAMREVLRAGKS